ncbi:MAG: arsenate reductase family protein [Culicoidibacterales bacterium]
MNIQIFGTKKCFETKKAQRYFKERGVKFQFIDLSDKGMSKGEFHIVKQAVGGLDACIDLNAKDKKALALITYLTPESKEAKLLETQQLLKTPIVRNGKQATVGFAAGVWKTWE